MNKKGVTLIELVVTMLVVAIIASATSGIIVSLMQLFVYLPREMRARTVAQEAMEIMTEGAPDKRGMQYAVKIQDASSTQFTYTFGYPGDIDKRIMRFRWDNTTNKLYRSYTAFGDIGYRPSYSQEEAIPYYAGGDISIKGNPASPATIFKYFEASGSQWQGTDLNTIRRVEISIVVTTGTGLFQYWDSSFQTDSSCETKQYL